MWYHMPFTMLAHILQYLGVVFDDQLRWHSHISHVCKKISYYIYWIYAHYKHLPNDVLKQLIDSLVLSRLTYALPVWGPASSKQCIMRLQRQHNWAVRIVKSLRKYDHVSAHQVSLGWLPVETLIRYWTLCTMHQLYHKQTVLLDPPILFGSEHNYSTQCPLTFANFSRRRLSRTQTSFHYRGAKWWNDLPDSIITSRDFYSTLYNYRIAGNFDGGKYWRFWRFQPDRQNLTRQIFKAIQRLVKDCDHPSKYFPSNIWKVSVRQNFPPSKFPAIRYLLNIS